MKKFYEMTDEELKQTRESLKGINSEEVNNLIKEINDELKYRDEQAEKARREKEKAANAIKEEENRVEKQKMVLGKFFVDETGGVYYKVCGVFNDHAIVLTAGNQYGYKTIKLDTLLSYKAADRDMFEGKSFKKVYFEDVLNELPLIKATFYDWFGF